MLQRQRDARARLARGTAADRVDHHHDRARPLQRLVDLGRGPQFLDPQPGELLAHGRDEEFGIRH